MKSFYIQIYILGSKLVFQSIDHWPWDGNGFEVFFHLFGICSPKVGAVGKWTVWNDFQEYSSISSEEEDEAQQLSGCRSQCEHLLHVMYVS